MAPGGLCHPADNFGTVLAAAEYAKASGEEFMLALAISYEIQCRFTAAVPLMDKGFNHSTQLAISIAASCGRLFNLSEEQIANAIAMSTVDNVSLACMHSEPVSQWKAFSPGITGMRAVYLTLLAKKGFTGPMGLFEGPKGLQQVLGQPVAGDWENPSFTSITQTVLKKYESLIHGQPLLEAILDLRRTYDLKAEQIEHVRCDVFQTAYDFAGGGAYGAKGYPETKEQGDYNLKYLCTVALLDGEVGPHQLRSERIRSPEALALFRRVEIQPDAQLTARYPKELTGRATIHTRDGRVLTKEHLGYEGGVENPLSWDRAVAKFHWLSEAFASKELRDRIVKAVDELDRHSISGITELLALVNPTEVYPRTSRGI